MKILEGRTENAIKNRFQLVFAKLRKRKENKSKPELELITDYVRENGGVIPVKKQREPAEKIEPTPPLPSNPTEIMHSPKQNPSPPPASSFKLIKFSQAASPQSPLS